jgi:hypothetical protein
MHILVLKITDGAHLGHGRKPIQIESDDLFNPMVVVPDKIAERSGWKVMALLNLKVP